MRLDEERRGWVTDFLAQYPSPVTALHGFSPKLARFAIHLLGRDEADQEMKFGIVQAAARYCPQGFGRKVEDYLIQGGIFALRAALGRRARWARDGTAATFDDTRARPDPRAAQVAAAELVDHPCLNDRQALVLDALYRVGLDRKEAAALLGLATWQVGHARESGLAALRKALSEKRRGDAMER